MVNSANITGWLTKNQEIHVGRDMLGIWEIQLKDGQACFTILNRMVFASTKPLQGINKTVVIRPQRNIMSTDTEQYTVSLLISTTGKWS